MGDQVVLMNVRVVVTQEQGGLGDVGDGPCEIRAFKDGVSIDNAHVPELPKAEVGDALIDTIMCCAMEHGLDPPDDIPPDERPRLKPSAVATALRKVAGALTVRDDLDLHDAQVEVDGVTYYVTVTTEPPK